MDNEPIYRVVYIATGKTFEGGLPETSNREVLVVALAEMMEIVSYWRGKLEVRP